MNLKNDFEPIRDWAISKGIVQGATQETQFLKLMEEVGELSVSIQKNDYEEFKDAVGDCVVVLTILAQMKGIRIEHCIEGVYDVISKRKGKMVDGVFVKDV
jgi:NTP pyrophosphatase (non-canonical NTP hydrolase)